MANKKWPYERVDEASDKTIDKAFVEHKHREPNKKGVKTIKLLNKHVNILSYSKGTSQVVNDPIIIDQMANLGCLLVCNFS